MADSRGNDICGMSSSGGSSTAGPGAGGASTGSGGALGGAPAGGAATDPGGTGPAAADCARAVPTNPLDVASAASRVDANHFMKSILIFILI
jgi:hypothetical protein